MLDIKIKPKQGNIYKDFPIEGYLGMSTCRVVGFAYTEILDKKPLKVKEINVKLKCIENAYKKSTVLFETTDCLMSFDNYVELGEMEKEFMLTIPSHSSLPSSIRLHNYQILWKLEVNLYHENIKYIGNLKTKSICLNLFRFSHLTRNLSRYEESIKSLEFKTSIESFKLLSLDNLNVNINLRLLSDDIIIKKLYVSLDRKVSFRLLKNSFFTSNNYSTRLIEHSVTPHLIPSKRENYQFTILIPSSKSKGSWSIGESLITNLIDIQFFITTTVLIKNARGSTKKVEIDSKEILLISITNKDLNRAIRCNTYKF